MTTITKNMVKPEYDTLKARKLRMHDLHSIKAMHPDIRIRAAAATRLSASMVCGSRCCDMTTSHDDLQRGLGRVEGNQTAMEARMDRFEKLVSEGFEKVEGSLDKISSRLGMMEDRENERKGAWKVMALVASIVSSVVAFVVTKVLG